MVRRKIWFARGRGTPICALGAALSGWSCSRADPESFWVYLREGVGLSIGKAGTPSAARTETPPVNVAWLLEVASVGASALNDYGAGQCDDIEIHPKVSVLYVIFIHRNPAAIRRVATPLDLPQSRQPRLNGEIASDLTSVA